MNWPASTARSRLLATAMLTVTLGIALGGMGHALRERAAYHAQLGVIHSQAHVYEQLIADAPLRKQVVSQIDEALTRDGLVIEGASANVAARAFDLRLRALLGRSGVRSPRVETEFRRSGGGRVALLVAHVTAECPIAEMVRAMYMVQQAQPHLYVDKLQVDSDQMGKALLPGPHVLHVSLSIVGAVRMP